MSVRVKETELDIHYCIKNMRVHIEVLMEELSAAWDGHDPDTDAHTSWEYFDQLNEILTHMSLLVEFRK